MVYSLRGRHPRALERPSTWLCGRSLVFSLYRPLVMDFFDADSSCPTYIYRPAAAGRSTVPADFTAASRPRDGGLRHNERTTRRVRRQLVCVDAFHRGDFAEFEQVLDPLKLQHVVVGVQLSHSSVFRLLQLHGAPNRSPCCQGFGLCCAADLHGGNYWFTDENLTSNFSPTSATLGPNTLRNRRSKSHSQIEVNRGSKRPCQRLSASWYPM